MREEDEEERERKEKEEEETDFRTKAIRPQKTFCFTKFSP